MTQATLRDTATGIAVGTEIATLDGIRPVETLAEGDRLVSHDGGAQRVVWAGSAPTDAPLVRIPEGAFDNDAELCLAPGQRLLWADWHAELLFGSAEVLVEARDLVGMNGIGWTEPDTREVWQVALTGPDMVMIAGAWSETNRRTGDAADQTAARPVLNADEVRVLRSYGDYESRTGQTEQASDKLPMVA